LVLPDDALALDPKERPQSLRSWIQEKARNAVTNRRKTVYVAGTPLIAEEVSVMSKWTAPVSKHAKASTTQPEEINPSRVVEYIAAFYHGLPVKPYPRPFEFVSWDGRAPKGAPSFVGLRVGDSCTRVRTRTCPDRVFSRQLNLNDILDALIANLPADAYAVLLLTDYDLYEDDDDDFCCGRAYGGSRIAVASTARYRPELDEYWGIDTQHMWPASHCATYVSEMCGEGTSVDEVQVPPREVSGRRVTPLGAAIEATRSITGPSDQYGLWLSRFVRTASHELGHCFALGHCVYYACVMQGTAGMAEDVRQPPYLCPVCQVKVTRAVLDVTPGMKEDEYVAQRNRALAKYCDDWKKTSMFAGYQAWLGCMLNPPSA
jgi:archaemetzincin